MYLVISKLMSEGTPDDCSTPKGRFLLKRDSLVEFFATFLFIYSGIMAALASGRTLVADGVEEDVARIMPIAWAFGVSILTIAYSIGHLSGGHMNPAVSLMMVFKRQLSWTKMIAYWIAQFLAALLAAAVAWGGTSGAVGQPWLHEDGTIEFVQRPPFNLGATTLDPVLSQGNGFLLELMGSCVFFFVIAQTALDKRGIAPSMFPAIPIGFSLVVVHCFLIPYTGCGVNPARTFGPSMVVCMSGSCDEVVQSSYWIYYIGPFLASCVIAEITEWLSIDFDDESDDEDGQGEVETKPTAEEQPVAADSKAGAAASDDQEEIKEEAPVASV